MRVLSVISFTVAATIFTYLIGATLGSPVQFFDDVTTVASEAQRDDVDSTTQVVYADEPAVTGETVTLRARQGAEEDDDDDDVVTSAPVVSTTTLAPVKPPLRNESTILSEFNFVAQPVAAVKAPIAIVSESVDEEDDPAVATQAPASEQGSEDNDSENEISQDDAGTTFKPSNRV